MADYIKAIQSIQKGNKEVDDFFKKVEELYSNFKNRIEVENWQKLFENDLLKNEETNDMLSIKLLDYLSFSKHLPSNVWAFLNNMFEWQENYEKLAQRYPVAYLRFIQNMASDKKFDFHFHLFDTSVDKEFDKFFDIFSLLIDRVNAKDVINATKTLTEIEKLNIEHPMLTLEKARIASLNKNIKEALELFDSVLEKYPNEYKNTAISDETKAFILLNSNEITDVKESARIYEELVAENKNHYWARVGLIFAIDRLDKNKALEIAIETLNDFPSSQIILNYLNITLPTAIEELKEEYNKDNTNNDIILKLGHYYLLSARYEECRKLLENHSINDYRYYNYLAFSNVSLGNTGEAEVMILKSIDLMPCFENYNILALIKLSTGTPDDVIEIENKIKGLEEPTIPLEIFSRGRIYEFVANAYYSKYDSENALKAINKSLEINREWADSFALKTAILIDLGRFEEALENIRRAITLNPQNITYQEILMEIFFKTSSFDVLNNIINQVEQNGMSSPAISFYKGATLRRLGKIAESTEVFETLIQKANIKDWEEKSLYELAGIYFEKDDLKKSLEYLEEALEIAKEFNRMPEPVYYLTLSRLYNKMGDSLKDFETLQKGLLNHKNNNLLMKELAFYYSEKEPLKSIETWKDIIKVYPTDAMAYANVVKMLESQSKIAEAISILEDAKAHIGNDPNLYSTLAYYYIGLGNKKEATKYIDVAISMENSDRNKELKSQIDNYKKGNVLSFFNKKSN
ncbi:MAG: hypothetical protein FWF57_08830 [Defluviitaleaceae bacterium]|nr:hypothetical protein [Defluviitaleaceae bacterium]